MSEPAPTPRRKRPLGRLLRWLGVLLILVLISSVVTAVIWVKSDDFQARTVPVVERLVEGQTGEAFTLKRIDLQFWPPAVELEKPRLWHIETQEVIVSAHRVRAPLVLRAGGPRLGKLTIDALLVELHLEEGGLREFRQLSSGGGKLERVPWSSLEIRDGTFRLHIPDGRLVLTDLTVAPTKGYRADLTANLVFWYQTLEDRTAIEWRDIQLGPDTIAIPHLFLDSGLLHVNGSATIPLDGDLVADLSARADLDDFNTLLKDPRAVHGLVNLDAHVFGRGNQVTLDGVVLVDQLSLDVTGIQVPVLHYELGDLVAAFSASRAGAQIERLVLDTGAGTLEAWGWVTPDLELEDVRVIAERVSLEHLLKSMDAAPTPWVDFDGDLEAILQGTLNPLHLEGPFELVVADWNVGDRSISDPEVRHLLEIPHAYAKGNLVIEFDYAHIVAPVVRGPNNWGSANVLIGFGPKGPLDLRWDMAHTDLSDFKPLGDVELRGVGRIAGRIAGPFNGLSLEADGDVEGFEVTGIPYADHLVTPIRSPHMKTIELPGARAVIGNTRYAGNFILDFRDPMSLYTDILVSEGRAEDLIQMFVDLEGIRGDLEGTLTLSGPLMDMDGEAHLTFSDVDLYGERFPYGEGHGYMDTGVFTLDDLRLLRDDGRAGVMLRGSVQREYALNMEVVGDGFRLEHLDHLTGLNLPLSGRVSVVARVDNKIYDPAPHGRLLVTDVRYSGVPVGDSAVKFQTTNGVSHYEGKLVGGTVAVVGTQGLWEEQPYSVFASFANFPLNVLYPEGANGEPVQGSFSGRLNLDGHFGEHWSPVSLTADIRDLELQWRRHELANSGPWHYEQEGNGFDLTGFSLEGGQTALALERASRGPEGLDLRGGGQVDLNLLQAFVPGLTRSEGYADITFTAQGRGRMVETVVDAEVYGSIMRHDSFPEAFEDVRATVRATQDSYWLSDVTAGLGGGEVAGGGRIDAEGWIPTRWNLSGEARDTQLQWIDALPPAIGDADLTFDGPVGALLLAGDVRVNEMDFVERIDWEDWVVDWQDWSLVDATPVDYEPWFSMDIAITADHTVTLRNNVAEGTASADLRIIGDTARAGLVGEARIDDGVAFLQDREFQVDRGLISYRDPWTWDPDLDFELVTDITSRTERYRVHYLVRGPFSNWTTETRSEPSLPQADINALLWFGVTADDLEGMGELPQAVAQGVADMILTDLFITRGGGVREELGALVDRVEIATGVDSRGEYSSDPRLVLEKRVDAWDTTGRVEWNLVRP
ncbi:MAG: translocation/assembly module TamB domain-containing protein, partial [Deltaproteobacteria bacterium]|nr:translocation/assembly module TamB domain-containing protein [Deltaproteobacteria bacterium]